MNLSKVLSRGVLAAGAVLAVAAGAPAATAAVTTGAQPGVTHTVPCSSTTKWLLLATSTGSTCYSGAGQLAVHLQGVRGGEVYGTHQACLSSLATRTCLQGPNRVFVLTPPRDITGITLSDAFGAVAGGAQLSFTRPVPCGSSTKWLRLVSDLGNTCYNGTGMLRVNLLDVRGEQVYGHHLACLLGNGTSSCLQGPAGPVAFAPRNVSQISLSTR